MVDALQDVTLFGTPAVGLRALAIDVLDASYRHCFANTLPDASTDESFEVLLDQSRSIDRETLARLIDTLVSHVE